jgi:hypothetical protein
VGGGSLPFVARSPAGSFFSYNPFGKILCSIYFRMWCPRPKSGHRMRCDGLCVSRRLLFLFCVTYVALGLQG